MFIPATAKEVAKLGWSELDIILLSGDAYIDTSYSGAAIIGKWLIKNGYRVAIIPQPRIDVADDVMKFGEPLLFWGVTAGAMDSMVSNYTALKKKRRDDDLTAGGINNKRPDRATLRYVNAIQRFANTKKPIVLGGVEASLRRLVHYDYWEDKLRRSILLDSKADYLVYGEGERTILQIADALRDGGDVRTIRGMCYIANVPPNTDSKQIITLPSYEECLQDKNTFAKFFKIFYQNTDPLTAKTLVQQYGNRYVIQNPVNYYLEGDELDAVYDMDYENAVHPIHHSDGEVRGLNTTAFSVTTHRGCFGECNFCSISLHQGHKIRSRSEASVLREVEKMTTAKHFKGNINDVGGATANMYGMECTIEKEQGHCLNKRCLFPHVCSNRNINHHRHLSLLQKVQALPNVKRVFVNSGLRYDLVRFDKRNGSEYFDYIVRNCTSGQLKIAPEHTETAVLSAMGKPSADLEKFVKDFYFLSKRCGKRQYLTYYFIAGHPQCDMNAMRAMRMKLKRMQIKSHQVQIFTPTPSTYSTLMYYTGEDIDGKKIFVEKSAKCLDIQKHFIMS
jgi:uncharacterized radical SAM protein YgiQ